jgi:hypothetical protein
VQIDRDAFEWWCRGFGVHGEKVSRTSGLSICLQVQRYWIKKDSVG